MIACDGCNEWFHYRCVGVQESNIRDQEMWFCPTEKCQKVEEEQAKQLEYPKKKGKSSKKTLVTDENSDKSSVKSDRQSGSLLEKKLKELEREQRAKEKELEMERLLRQKRMEMDRVLKEKRLKMENEMRQQEMEQEKELLEKALKDEQAHLKQMEQMREKYQAKIASVKGKLNATTDSKNQKRKQDPLEGHSKGNKLAQEKNQSGLKPAKGTKSGKTEARPVDSENEDSEEETEEGESDSGDDGSDEENEEENEESEETYDESEEESEEEMKPEKKSKKRQVKKKVELHGLGQKSAGPTKTQLAARNGICRKLPIFTGKPEEWPLFIGSYEASNEACGYNDIENLVLLQESLKGPALESVRGQLLLPKSIPKAEKLGTFIPFGNAVEQLCDHLEAADLEQHLVNPLLVQSLVDKLPSSDKREWVRFKTKKKKATLRTFADFLSRIVSEACEANACVEVKGEAKDSRYGKAGKGAVKEKGAFYNHSVSESSRESNAVSTTVPENLKPCKACKRTDHRLRFCQDFKAMSIVDRMKIVEKAKLCKICLNDHGNAVCRFKMRCNVGECWERHHPLLHPTVSSIVMNTHINLQGTVLFRMIPVSLHCGNRTVKTLAFLDEGASITLVERSLTDQLGVKGILQPLTIKWTADVTRVEEGSTKMNLWISASGDQEKLFLKSVQTVEQLLLPKQSLDGTAMSSVYHFLRDLPISSYSSQRPGILIGLNNLHVIAPMQAKIGEQGEPIAVRSKLGWSVYGPTGGQPHRQNFVGYHHEITNENLHNLLKEQYALEESVVAVSQESKEEIRAREILERTTVRVGDRFETGMLWKTDNPKFPNSFPMAVRRLKQLEQRLEKTPELYENVRKQIEEYQHKGYAHLATQEELAEFDPQESWFLPINVVLNPKKPAKVRLVWDAAATVNGVSLNSQLLTGPDMLTPLPGVLNRFRERPIGFGGDIREMYHQLLIRAADKKAQMFVFRDSSRDSPSVYIMDVATFGSKCSPCQAQFVKNQNAIEFSTQFPEAAAAIIEKHYVDDYFDSVDTIEEAITRATDVRYVHSKGGFEIRNWVSNSGAFLDELGEVRQDQSVHFNQDKESGTERVLGIIWDPRHDEFSFSMEHRQDVRPYLLECQRPTKRIVLSCVMGFFDPLGLLTPFTIHGKMVVQDLWRTGCEWDDEVDDESLRKWERWTGLLPTVEDIRIPRCYFKEFRSTSINSLELHVFTDASIHAYGCAAYFRAVIDGDVRCSLVMSRSKVAPLKLQSVPRLELMAAVLGAMMLQTVRLNHSLTISKFVLWSDSQTVLSWIRSDQHKYKQFVAFRICEILELTSTNDWRYVPSDLNIADVVTKWGQGPPLESDGPWFNGPQFLHKPESEWPEQQKAKFNVLEEMKACMLFHDASSPVINVNVMSRWLRLIRIAANVVRFIANCRRKIARHPILVSKAGRNLERSVIAKPESIWSPLLQDELQAGEIMLVKQAQQDSFEEEVKILETSRGRNPDQSPVLVDKSSWLYKLSPIIDANGIVRMGGRLALSESVPFDTKFPVILPKRQITSMIIQYYHEKYGHANKETVFNELRQRFYIPKLRSTISLVVKDCMWCKVNQCQPQVPVMAPLPVQRVTPQLRPFSSVGVDYLGPVEVLVGRRREKRWVALFTCLAVRAIHLEVVHSLTTQACMMAIRRFICKRGSPDEFFSDNGANFKGASNEMYKTKQKVSTECAESVTSPAIKWHFIPPGTPHMGGSWERMVRSVKEAMRALDDGRKLTDEILLTTLSEAEDMVNSRPLTYLPQETEETEAITPNHFLRGAVKDEDQIVDGEVELADALRNVYKRSQYLADRMWKRWSKEYLPSINRRTKWYEERRPLQVGDLVFIVDGAQRKNWVRGIVEEVVEAVDGKIRQAMVKTNKGVFRRAVANLAVVEIPGNSGTSGRAEPELRAGV
ncbi:uncharacterized protein LOC135698436 [Ochlerotatus camptorhynchus]|uniref:uncharacterized protein LOC135698436 n=1 Tax=Ochlerotatus camptorhynchus TaxID=644619 RepID=UPI0031D6CEA8